MGEYVFLEVQTLKRIAKTSLVWFYLTHIEWYGMKLRNTYNFVVRSSSKSRDRRTFQFIPSGLASVGTELLTRVRQGRYLRWEPKNLKWADSDSGSTAALHAASPGSAPGRSTICTLTHGSRQQIWVHSFVNKIVTRMTRK